MKIILTEDFKNSTILAEKGIRCILRGFALVNDTRHWLQKLYNSNLYDFEAVTLEELQEHCQLVTDEDKNDPDLLNNLFDITYEPCLELSTPDTMPCTTCGGTGWPDWKKGTGVVDGHTCTKCDGTGYVAKTNEKGTVLGGEKFGTYKIRINSMRNNKTERGLQGTYQAIVLIGEKYIEDGVHVITTNKSYIGIILYFDGVDDVQTEIGGVTEEHDGLHIGPDSAFTINFQFSLSQIHMTDGEQPAVLETEYDEIMKYSSQKDQTTTQLAIPGAFLVPSGKEYSKRVDLEDGRKKEHLGIAYMDKTFNLIPDTYKNNNIFNVTPRFNIFDEHNDKFVKPLVMISHGGMTNVSDDDNTLGSATMVNQSVAIEYDKKWFAMNEKAPTGKSRFDLFGGATKHENSAYDDSHFMNTTGYMRLVSDRGYHLGGENLAEVLSNANTAGIYDGALYVSDNNIIGEAENSATKTTDFHTIDTEGITAKAISGALLVDSNRSVFGNLAGLTAFGTHKASAFNERTTEYFGTNHYRADENDPYFCHLCQGTGKMPLPTKGPKSASTTVYYVSTPEKAEKYVKDSKYQSKLRFILLYVDERHVYTDVYIRKISEATLDAKHFACNIADENDPGRVELFEKYGFKIRWITDDPLHPDLWWENHSDTAIEANSYRYEAGHQYALEITGLDINFKDYDLGPCEDCSGDGRVGAYTWPGRIMMYGLNTSSFDFNGYNNTFIGHKGLLSNYGHDAIIFGKHNACGNKEYDMCLPCKGEGRVLCTECSGSGKVVGIPKQDCTACLAFGYVTYSGDKCGYCDGTGVKDGETCYMCGGNKYENYPGLESYTCSAFVSGYDAIYTCPVCNGTTEIDVPNTTAYVECPNCEGIGRSKCPDCAGEGFNEGYVHPLAQSACPTCTDKMTACQSCSGQGYYGDKIECKTCDGTGKFLSAQCTTCSGRGFINRKCTFCGGDRQVCKTCSGYGDLVCDVCGGDDIIDCPECNSPSNVKCDLCDGTGWTTDNQAITAYVGELEGENYLNWSKTYLSTSDDDCPRCEGMGTEPAYIIHRFMPHNTDEYTPYGNQGDGIKKYAVVFIEVQYEVYPDGTVAWLAHKQLMLDAFTTETVTWTDSSTEVDEDGNPVATTISRTMERQLFTQDLGGTSWDKPGGCCLTNGTFYTDSTTYGASIKLFDSIDEINAYVAEHGSRLFAPSRNWAEKNANVKCNTVVYSEKDPFTDFTAQQWVVDISPITHLCVISFDDCIREANYVYKSTTKYDGINFWNAWEAWGRQWGMGCRSSIYPNDFYTAWTHFQTAAEATYAIEQIKAICQTKNIEADFEIRKVYNTKMTGNCKLCLGIGKANAKAKFKCPKCSNIADFKDQRSIVSAYNMSYSQPARSCKTWVPEHIIMFKNYYTPSAQSGWYNPNINLLGKHACELCDGVGYVSREQRVAFLGEAFEDRYERLYQNQPLWNKFFNYRYEGDGYHLDGTDTTLAKMLYIGTDPSSGSDNMFVPESFPTTGLSSLCPKCTDFFNHFFTDEMMNTDVKYVTRQESWGPVTETVYENNDTYGYAGYKKKNVKEKIQKVAYTNDKAFIYKLGADRFCDTCNFNGTRELHSEQVACLDCHGVGYNSNYGSTCENCGGTGVHGKQAKYFVYGYATGDHDISKRLFFNGTRTEAEWSGEDPNDTQIDQSENTTRIWENKTAAEQHAQLWNGFVDQVDAKCTSCDGTGIAPKITCTTCGGTGKTTSTFTDGHIQCPNCIGGYLLCEECDGVKHWYCNTCGGDGIVEFQPTIAYEDGKVMAVGDGYFYKNLMTDETDFDMYRDYINIKPADNCDLNVGQYIKKMNLFSVEQNGMLMVHNNNYDQIPDPHVKHNLATDFFAVRAWAKYNDLEDRYANLQNGCYAPDAIYFTKRTAHNEEWKLRIRELDYLLNDSYIKTNASMLKTAALNQAIYDFHRKNTTFLLRLGPIINYCWKGKKGYTETITVKGKKGAKGRKGAKGLFAGMKGGKGWKGSTTKTVNKTKVFIAYEGSTLGVKGDKGMKGLKGLKGLDEFKNLELHITGYRYKFYIADILAAVKQEFGRSISNTGNLGKNSETYTFYCINGDPENNLYFKGVRLRKTANGNYQTLNSVKGIKPAQVQRIVYKDNGYNGEYGVMNFNYAYNNRFLA